MASLDAPEALFGEVRTGSPLKTPSDKKVRANPIPSGQIML
jgi:hypothetical protein